MYFFMALGEGAINSPIGGSVKGGAEPGPEWAGPVGPGPVRPRFPPRLLLT
jgi:hypothetical protein